MSRIRGYTLVELIVIILMIAVGSTIVLAIHTRLQREKLDSDDDAQMRNISQKLSEYQQKSNGRFPSVEPYISEPDRISRFSDYRQRPGKALRLLFRNTGNGSDDELTWLYSPLDGAMPEAVQRAMAPNADPADKCFSSYSYDPGHVFSTDANTVIFGHSPSFLRRHGRSTVRVINAQLTVYVLHQEPDSSYSIKVRTSPNSTTETVDSIFEDQSATLFNRDSYLNDLIPFR